MKQASYSSSNFFPTNQVSSCSFDKPKACKSPVSQQLQMAPMLSKFQNLKSLQKIKDQIQSLQNTLTNNQQPQKPKHLNHEGYYQNPNQNKSFLVMIKNQLKQVNQLTENTNPKISRKNSLYKEGSKEQSPKKYQSNANNTKSNVLRTLLNLQHSDLEHIQSQEKQVLSEKLIALEDKKIRLLKKLKRRYREEKEKIKSYVEQLMKEEELVYQQKMRSIIEERLKPAPNQQDGFQKCENKWLNTLRQSRSQSGRAKYSKATTPNNNLNTFNNTNLNSTESSSSESLGSFLKKKQSGMVQDDSLKLQLVSSLKKESPNHEKISRNKNKKKKQKVRFKKENVKKEDPKVNQTQPLQRFKTEDGDNDSDTHLNSLINRYY